METQKALEKHIEECKHRIEIVKEYMLLHKDADVSYCMGNIKEWETVILALEKQIPKKAKEDTEESVRYCKVHICPSCGEKFTGESLSNNCYHCGQAFDWSDSE